MSLSKSVLCCSLFLVLISELVTPSVSKLSMGYAGGTSGFARGQNRNFRLLGSSGHLWAGTTGSLPQSIPSREHVRDDDGYC